MSQNFNRPRGSLGVAVTMRVVFSTGVQQRLALMATAFLFPLAGATLTLPWLLVIRIARSVKERRIRWSPSAVDAPLAIFLLWALIAAVRSPLPSVAFGSWGLAALAFAIPLQVGLGTLRETPSYVQSLHKAFAVGTLGASIYGLLVLYTGHTGRAQLMTLGPNAFGFGLMVGILLSLPLFGSSRPWRGLAAFTVSIAVIALAASLSRSAVFGLAGGAIVYVWLNRCRVHLRLVVPIVAGATLGLLLVFGNPVMTPTLVTYLKFFHRAPSEDTRTAVLWDAVRFLFTKSGCCDRLVIWTVDLHVIRDRPWFGVGLGAFPFVVRHWAAGVPGADVRGIYQGTPPHSLYLGLGAEVGIPGALAFFAIPITAVAQGLRQRDSYGAGAISAVAGMLIAETRDTILFGYHMALGFVLLLAMLLTRPAQGRG